MNCRYVLGQFCQILLYNTLMHHPDLDIRLDVNQTPQNCLIRCNCYEYLAAYTVIDAEWACKGLKQAHYGSAAGKINQPLSTSIIIHSFLSEPCIHPSLNSQTCCDSPIKIPSQQTSAGIKSWKGSLKCLKRKLYFTDTLTKATRKITVVGEAREKKKARQFHVTWRTRQDADRTRGIHFLPLIGCLW